MKATIIPRSIAMFTEDSTVIRRIEKGSTVEVLSTDPEYIQLFGDRAYTKIDDGIRVGYVLSEALLMEDKCNGNNRQHS